MRCLLGFVAFGLIVAGCSGAHETDRRIRTLEARVAASDAAATAGAVATGTTQALVRSFANAIGTHMAQPTETPIATATVAPAPTQPVQVRPRTIQPPVITLSGSYLDQVQQAGEDFYRLTQTSASLVATPRSDAEWNDELRTNMLGYVALEEAWRTVVPPACAAAHNRGLAGGYALYANGANAVLTVLDAGSPSVLTAVAVDVNAPPLLKQGRAAGFSLEEVMRAAWGVSQQALDLGLATQLLQSLGLWGPSNADLGAFGLSYRAAGGAMTILSGPNGSCK